MKLLAIEFPPISHVVEWPALLLEDTPFEVNKVVILMWLSVILVFTIFYLGARSPQLVPTGVQNVAESTIDFVRNGIILQTMGPEGLPWLPFLLYSAIGTIAWTAALVYAGAKLEQNFEMVSKYVDLVTNGVLAVLGAMLIRRYIRCWRSKPA